MDEQKEVHVRTLPAQHVLTTRRQVALASIAAGMDSAFGALWRHLADTGVQPSGPPFVLYLGPPEGEFPIDVCIPVAPGAAPGEGIEARELPGGEAATLVHRGPYDGLSDAWQVLTRWVQASGRPPSGPPREVYVTDPRSSAPEDLLTELVIPLS
jgi:effector-binding domain-containing protein